MKAQGRTVEYVELVKYGDSMANQLSSKEALEQMRALLKENRRVTTLTSATAASDDSLKSLNNIQQPITNNNINNNNNNSHNINNNNNKNQKAKENKSPTTLTMTTTTPLKRAKKAPNKRENQQQQQQQPQQQGQKAQSNLAPVILTENQKNNAVPETAKANGSFLDTLCKKAKIGGFEAAKELSATKTTTPFDVSNVADNECSSYDLEEEQELLGFEPSEYNHVTTVSKCAPAQGGGIFISRSCDSFLQSTLLRKDCASPAEKIKLEQKNCTEIGLVTQHTQPPPLDCPAVPEELINLSVLPMRRNYLESLKPNDKTLVIYNEKRIYCGLQLKKKGQQTHVPRAVQFEHPGYPITRNAWRAASYINTENYKYFFQIIHCDNELIELHGTYGNNIMREKRPYFSFIQAEEPKCTGDCYDLATWKQFSIKSTKTKSLLSKYNTITKGRESFNRSKYLPCPLSKRTCNGSIVAAAPTTAAAAAVADDDVDDEDDFANLMLKTTHKVVVPVPTIAIEVRPQLDQPLQPYAQRYLEHVLPHAHISKEWAEFSVSTIIDPTKQEYDSLKTFSFPIPYERPKSHVTLYSFAEQSEKLDDHFKKAIETDTTNHLRDLSFRASITETTANEDAFICADIISDMINTVAISCAEHSFIKIDPDMIDSSVEPIKKPPIKRKPKPLKRPALDRDRRLQSELKRLNATFIDADVDYVPEDAEPCTNAYCTLGCVCRSNQNVAALREHCNKPKCMFQCKCIILPKSRITRLETEGVGISNEDAYLLREQATARLAPVEKEFTPTVIRTKSETLLINDGMRDKSRRCAKAPKRYEGAITDMSDLSPIKTKSTTNSTISSNSSNEPTPNKFGPQKMRNQSEDLINITENSCIVTDTDFERLKAFSIRIRPLHDMDNVAVYCMVHELYKCHCKGTAIEGKPVVIEKESASAITSKCSGSSAYYFEKSGVRTTPKRPPITKKDVPKPATKNLTNYSTLRRLLPRADNVNYQLTKVASRVDTHAEKQIQIQRNSTIEFFRKANQMSNASKLRAKAGLTRRDKAKFQLPATVEVIELNDSDSNDEDAGDMPTTSTGAAENEHSYFAQFNDSQSSDLDNNIVASTSASAAGIAAAVDDEDNDVVLINDSDEEVMEIDNAYDMNSKQTALKRKAAANDNRATISSKRRKISDKGHVMNSPQIINSRSLNDSANKAKQTNNGRNAADKQSLVRRNIEGIDETNLSPDDYRLYTHIQRDMLTEMNRQATKKMTEIRAALQKHFQLLPTPENKTISVLNWQDFVQLYKQKLVYVWSVSTPKERFFAATLSAEKPIDKLKGCTVVNIEDLLEERDQIKIVQLLLYPAESTFNSKLGLLMAGRAGYWRIKGFIKQDKTKFCTKPTPKTHSFLSKKINNFCKYLTTHRYKQIKARMAKTSARARASAPAAASSPAAVTARVAASTPVTAPAPASRRAPAPASRRAPAPASRRAPAAAPAPATATRPVAATVSASTTAILDQESRRLVVRKTTTTTTTAIVPSAELMQTAIATPLESQIVSNANDVGLQLLSPDSTPVNYLENLRRMQSNVEIRAINETDAVECILPPIHIANVNYRWYVIDLRRDFSHIYLRVFTELEKLDRHQMDRAFDIAREHNSFQELEFFDKGQFKGYVSPCSRRLLYLGPLPIDSPQPCILLIQSVDNNLMLREYYQQMHCISIDEQERTKAFWVYVTPNNNNLLQSSTTTNDNVIVIDDDDDDDNVNDNIVGQDVVNDEVIEDIDDSSVDSFEHSKTEAETKTATTKLPTLQNSLKIPLTAKQPIQQQKLVETSGVNSTSITPPTPSVTPPRTPVYRPAEIMPIAMPKPIVQCSSSSSILKPLGAWKNGQRNKIATTTATITASTSTSTSTIAAIINNKTQTTTLQQSPLKLPTKPTSQQQPTAIKLPTKPLMLGNTTISRVSDINNADRSILKTRKNVTAPKVYIPQDITVKQLTPTSTPTPAPAPTTLTAVPALLTNGNRKQLQKAFNYETPSAEATKRDDELSWNYLAGQEAQLDINTNDEPMPEAGNIVKAKSVEKLNLLSNNVAFNDEEPDSTAVIQIIDEDDDDGDDNNDNYDDLDDGYEYAYLVNEMVDDETCQFEYQSTEELRRILASED